MEDAPQALVKVERATTTVQLQCWDPQQSVQLLIFMLSIKANGSTLAIAGGIGMVILGSLSY
jgi:hypothetical protein